MLKPIPMGLLLCLALSSFSCQLENKSSKLDPETEKLQREVDSLRRIKEALQDELADTRTTPPATAEDDPSLAPSNAADGPLRSLTVLSAKKQFDANLNPILRVTFRNYAEKSVQAVTIGVDFSYNSTELSENCHFDQTLKLKLAPDTNETLTIPIPAVYNKNCADRAWVVIKEVVYSDGSRE